MGNEQSQRDGVTELLARMAEAFGRLLRQHVTLAQLELLEDAQRWSAELGQAAAFLPFLFVAYALGCGALVAFLAPWTGWVWAFGAVALGNAALGGAGLTWAIRRGAR